MPEGPEVTIITEGLNKLLKGKYINNFIVNKGSRYTKKAFDGCNQFMSKLPLKIIEIKNKGKFIYWILSDNTYVFQTLGMSGVWYHHYKPNTCFTLLYGDEPEHDLNSGNKNDNDKTCKNNNCENKNSNSKNKKDNTINNKKLYFVDQRHFATWKVVFSKQKLQDKLNTIGPDILNDTKFNKEKFLKLIKRYPNKDIASFLMNQKYISGIGNYLKSEILYETKINPNTLISNLSDSLLEQLYVNARTKIYSSYKKGGASLRHYSDIEDKKGLFEFEFKVYGKKQDPLGNTIISELTKDKRKTYWVPKIQTN
tara:strand:- start:2590 stop:3522 length:933 start_codon:yes stop_codon:yes gene_type:complete